MIEFAIAVLLGLAIGIIIAVLDWAIAEMRDVAEQVQAALECQDEPLDAGPWR